jgi:DNA-binding transcriptional MocR family regulator
LINACLRKISEVARPTLIDYPSPEAYRPTREGVLRWLSSAAPGPADADDVVLTQGGQSGLVMVMQSVLRGAAPVVLVEQLSYPGFRRAAELCRAKVVPVPMDEAGIIPEALEELTIKHDAQLLCTSAEAHNPTSLFTPQSRREAIAQVAARRGLHILEDDCYRLAPSRAPSYRSMLPDLGWYVGSISKTLTPALRFGFVVAPKTMAARLQRTSEYGFFGLSEPLAMLMAELLARDETYEIANRVRAETQRYVRAAVNGLGGFELNWAEDVPFLWLKLPLGWRTGSFVMAAEAEGVKLRSGEMFVPREAAVPQAVRIAANAQLSLPAFEQAVGKLRRLLDAPQDGLAV